MTKYISERLADIRDRITALESGLQTRVDPRDISKTSKVPFKVLSFREGLNWRLAELSRSAYEAYIDQKVAAAIILTRACMETAAAGWYVRRKIERVIDEDDFGDIDETLMKLLVGTKIDENMPNSINVMTFLDYVEREIPGIRRQYDELSEFAHPNWAGTLLLFGRNDKEQIVTDFGSGLRSEASIQAGAINLEVALMIFAHTYERIGEAMPPFTKMAEARLAQ